MERLRHGVFTRQFLSLTTGHLSIAVASFSALALLARAVTIEEFGQVIFAQATVKTIFVILDPRLEDAIVRYIPLIGKEAASGAEAKLFNRALLFDGVLGISFAAIGILLLSAGVIPMGGIAHREFFILATLQAGLQAAQGTAASGFSVTDGLTRLGLLQAALAILTAVLAAIGALTAGALGYLAMLALAAGVSTAVMTVTALRRIREHLGLPAQLPPGWIAGFTRFSFVASLTSSVRAGTDSLPLSIIGLVSGAGIVGGFRVGLAPARLATTAFSPLPAIMFPLLSREAANSRYEAIRSRTLSWTSATLPIVFVMATTAWVALPTLVPLIFGPRFQFAVQPARYLVLAALVRCTTAWSKVLALALGRSGVNLLITSLDGALLAGVTWWLASSGSASNIALGHLAVAGIVSLIWVRFAASVREIPKESAELVASGR